MTTYRVKPTRKSSPAISIPETAIDDSLAVKLFGRKRLAYGSDLNQNLLRLLETFSCRQRIEGGVVGPDKTVATDNMFDAPVEGQLWYNSTPGSEGLYFWDGGRWVSQFKFGEVAANWGVIADGGQIPLPVSPNGRTFRYDECSWVVSPYGYPNAIDYMMCNTDETANVTMEYSLHDDDAIHGGYANYLIVSIPDNTNRGELSIALPEPPTPTPTATLAATPASTQAATPPPTSNRHYY